MIFFFANPTSLATKFLFLLWLKIYLSLALPISTPNVQRHANSPKISEVIPFLKKFGYLRSNSGTNFNNSALDHEMLYTNDSVEDAIKQMQKFGGLEPTGFLNNETIKLLTTPRCGVPDIINEKNITRSKRYVIGAHGWNKRRITYRMENWTPSLDESSVLADLRKAFSVWADYARLNFINQPRWSQADETDISISFGRGYHGDTYSFDGSGGVLAHAFFPYGHGSLGGDIHFDADENWSSVSDSSIKKDMDQEDYTSVSFLSVAVHEIGHSLGLAHSSSQDSVMFPYYQGVGEGSNKNVHLGYDDIMAVYRLYIERAIEDDFGDDKDISTTTKQYTTQRWSTGSNPSDSTTTIAYDATTGRNETFTTSTAQPTKEDEEDNGNTIPDICQDGYDTITFMRNELFVFKGNYMWRFKERGSAEPYYPVELSVLFPMLKNVHSVDAAFENDKGQLIFISGSKYWIYDGTEHVGPFPLTNFGLPEDLDKVDAAFIWERNGKLYFFRKNLFWRYDTSRQSMDDGYPKDIERWRGLPSNGIDSVLKGFDGATYFFKNNDFWRFDDVNVHVSDVFPMKMSSHWFGC